jgi:hypothetical protein
MFSVGGMLGAGPVLRKRTTCKVDSACRKRNTCKKTCRQHMRMQEKKHVQDKCACRRGKHVRHMKEYLAMIGLGFW